MGMEAALPSHHHKDIASNTPCHATALCCAGAPLSPRTHPLCALHPYVPTTQAEEDEAKRDEKIRRASVDIKTAKLASPVREQLPRTPLEDSVALTPLQQLEQQQQLQPLEEDAQQEQQPRQHQQQQQPQHQQEQLYAQGSSQLAPLAPSAFVTPLALTPQEVLQELLGDLFVAPSRLIMRE